MTAIGGLSGMMEQMAAAGAPLEAILIAVRAVEAEQEKVAEKRAAAAKRKADERARKRQSRDSHATVTRQGADSPNDPPNDIYSNPPVPPVEASASTAPKGRVDRGSKIPEDWKPPAIADLSPEARALAERWPAAAYRAEAEAFKNYWSAETGKGSRKSNWDRAWANRIVAVNGRVMREAKATGAVEVGKAGSRPMNPAELRSAIAFAEDNGNPERAAELKRQLDRLQPPRGPAAGIIANVTEQMRARA